MARLNKILRNVLIFPIICSSFLVSCTEKDPFERRDYTDYQDYRIELDDLYKQKESSYFAYVYRPDCGSCTTIKAKVLNYIDSYKANNKDTKLYLIEVHHIDTDEGRAERAKFKEKPSDFKSNNKNNDKLVNEMKGVTSLEDTYFIGTPTIYFIKNSALFDVYVGSSKIKKNI